MGELNGSPTNSTDKFGRAISLHSVSVFLPQRWWNWRSYNQRAFAIHKFYDSVNHLKLIQYISDEFGQFDYHGLFLIVFKITIQ